MVGPEAGSGDPGAIVADPAGWLGFPPTRVLRLERGSLAPSAIVPDPRGWLGLLVLDGLLYVDVETDRDRIGWLIGEGDLIRPWQMGEIALTENSRWRALTDTRVALLDGYFRRRAAANGTLIETLMARLAHTCHWLLAKSLIASIPRVDERLLLWFVLCGERWGKVTSNGVRLDLPLTHDLLAALVGARRPTVTTSLRSLEAVGLLTPTGRNHGWLLPRLADSEQTNDRVRGAARYARALGLDLDLSAGGADHAPVLAPDIPGKLGGVRVRWKTLRVSGRYAR